MIKIKKEKKVFITSDTHYNHTNICRGVSGWVDASGNVPLVHTRDFNTLEEMNNKIVENINRIVGENDVLIHLGDWSFGGFEQIEIFRNKLICKEIHLVLGNHDHHIDRNREDCQSLFSSVQWFLQLDYGDEKIELMHYPISSWNNLRKGRIHLHGHCHLKHDDKITYGRRMDIGIDGHKEFRPYDLKLEVIDMLKELPISKEIFVSNDPLNNIG